MPKAPANWKALQRHPKGVRPDWPSDLREHVTDQLRSDGVWLDQKSVITISENLVLDGWNRLQCAIAADVEPPFQRLAQGRDQEAFVAQANDDRRHESMDAIMERAKERRAKAVELKQAGNSNVVIAAKTGVSEKTVRTDLEKASAEGADVAPPGGVVTDQKGAKRPAKKKKSGDALPIDVLRSASNAFIRAIAKFAKDEGLSESATTALNDPFRMARAAILRLAKQYVEPKEAA